MAGSDFLDFGGLALGMANTAMNIADTTKMIGLRQNQYELAKDSYYNGIKTKVKDAKEAGLHPLAVLGMQGATYNPVIDNDTPDNSLAELGQSVKQSADSLMQRQMAKKEMTLLDTQIDGAKLENESKKLDNLIKSQNIGFSGEYWRWNPRPNAQGFYTPQFTEIGQPYSQLHSEADGIPQTYNQLKMYRAMYDNLVAQGKRNFPVNYRYGWDSGLRMPIAGLNLPQTQPLLSKKDLQNLDNLIADMVRGGLTAAEITNEVKFLGEVLLRDTAGDFLEGISNRWDNWIGSLRKKKGK